MQLGYPQISNRKSITGILIALPCYTQLNSMYTTELLYPIAQLLTANGIPSQLMPVSMNGIGLVRNILTTVFYDNFPQCSHLLQIDDDMQFSPLLIKDMLELDKPVTGAVYCKRRFPVEPIGENLSDDEPITNGFQKWRFVGAGVLMIKRHVIKEMMEKMPEVNDCADPGTFANLGVTRMIRAFDPMMHPERGELSEDYSFCERWRRCGGEVWASVGHPIGHLGQFNYKFQWTMRKEIMSSTCVAA